MNRRTILTPYFLNQTLPGLKKLAEDDWIINQVELPEGDQVSQISVLHKSLADQVEKIVRGDLLPVSLAGDCCTAIGVLAGLNRAGLYPLLIWFDAHGDFNTWETTPSGFLGGMPLAMLAGLGEQTLLEALDLEPLVQERIILTDGRDLDPGESELVANSLVTHLRNPMDLLDESFQDQPLWVHFDTDVVNTVESPAQNYPAAGGPGVEVLENVFQYLADTGMIRAISVSSWAPGLPGEVQSEAVSLRLIEILVGGNNK
ncbi:MAG: arginase family protein [Anaerolineales bacterium]|nr:arginase family protein [Anaerolineales bacterium]